ncbi:hypothetical protein ACFXDJ_15100 [Streptomyces sp. NPDC059443]|uniref:hypothetical protein n=1 Tax=unclassified Streptomyces TaxID=2593676 RepID=UPI003679A3A2
MSETGIRDCTRRLEAHDVRAVGAALAKLRAARRCAEAANAQIDGILRAGGYEGTRRPPATGAAVLCDRSA